MRIIQCWSLSRCNLFILDSGTTCRNDNVEIQCYDYNTYGRISVASATWKYGCGWNFNTVNPSDQNVIGALSGHCTNYNRCSPTVNDGNIGSCTSAYAYSGSSYSYPDTYWCNHYGWYSCDRSLSSYNTLPYYSICGKLYWGYTCKSKWLLIFLTWYIF
jgi:hypothetical protein